MTVNDFLGVSVDLINSHNFAFAKICCHYSFLTVQTFLQVQNLSTFAKRGKILKEIPKEQGNSKFESTAMAKK